MSTLGQAVSTTFSTGESIFMQRSKMVDFSRALLCCLVSENSTLQLSNSKSGRLFSSYNATCMRLNSANSNKIVFLFLAFKWKCNGELAHYFNSFNFFIGLVGLCPDLGKAGMAKQRTN